MTCTGLGNAKEPTKSEWKRALDIGFEIVNLKKPVVASADACSSMFENKVPELKPDWRLSLPSDVENATDARALPDFEENELRLPKNPTPIPRVVRYSENKIAVAICKPVGSYLWHHYYECLALLEIDRSKEIDAYFDLPHLEQTYGAKLRGISQGSSLADTRAAFGEPSSIRGLQKTGSFELTYNNDAMKILFDNNHVHKFTRLEAAPEDKR